MPHFAHVSEASADEEKHDRHDEQPRDLKHPQQRAPRHDPYRQDGQQDATGEPAEFLVRLHDAGDLLANRRRERARPPASPGTMRGMCWMAPKAAPKAHANMIVVTIVVRA